MKAVLASLSLGLELSPDLLGRWECWVDEMGPKLLEAWSRFGGEPPRNTVGLAQAVVRRGALDGPEAPPLLDVGIWLVAGEWWLVVGVTLGPEEALTALDAVPRSAVQGVGLSHHVGNGGGPSCELEVALAGPGFAGVAGRRWAGEALTLAVGDDGAPLAVAAGEAPFSAFLSALVAAPVVRL